MVGERELVRISTSQKSPLLFTRSAPLSPAAERGVTAFLRGREQWTLHPVARE